jgi:SAM-dependent methyltransferase
VLKKLQLFIFWIEYRFYHLVLINMENASQFREFAKWLVSSPGSYYLGYEQQELNSLLSLFHGFYFVQLGLLDVYNLNGASAIMQRVYVGNDATKIDPNLIVDASLSELPFQSESVDCFFLPHTLEFAPGPSKLLREVYNILVPGGKVIIFGFNPFSVFGLTRWLKSAKNVSWHSKLYSMGRVKNWLYACGFSLDYQKYLCYRSSSWGSLYMLVAQKKSVVKTPIKEKIIPKQIAVAGGFPEPSTNKGLS